MTSSSRDKMVSINLRFGLAIVGFFIGFASTFALSIGELPSIVEEDISCILHCRSQVLSCSWPPEKFLDPEPSVVELLYEPVMECSKNVSHVICQDKKPPCSIPDIRLYLCNYYNISLKLTYTTSQGSVSLASPWKQFYLSSIAKYPQLSAQIKDVEKTCITLEWTKMNPVFDFDVIQFEYTSQWEPNQVDTLNITSFRSLSFFATVSTVSRKLCGLIPSTLYMIKVRIRPSTSHIWSDAYTLNGSTADSVPSRSPLTISGAFYKRISSNKAIIYWKELSEKEWQSDPMEGTYFLFMWNASSEQWQQFRDLPWNVSQTEILLFEEQDTIVRLLSHNWNGYSENYSEIITIPLRGPPVPTDVTAVIIEAEKEVRFSWDSEFNEEVVIFWCLWGNEYQCRQNSLDWRLLNNVSNKSATLYIEDVDPSSQYMFGVSVSHLNISSGIQWLSCIDEQDVYRSNCNSSYAPTRIDNGSKTSMAKVKIIASTFGTLFMVVVVVAIIYRCRRKWSLKSEGLEPFSRLRQAKSDNTVPLGERDQHPSNEEKEFKEGNGLDIDRSSEPNDTGNCYDRFGVETSFTTIKETTSPENNNNESDASSGNSSGFSGNSSSNGDDSEPDHYGTRTSIFDQDKSNSSDYNMRHQRSEEGSSGNSSDFSGNSSNVDGSEPDHYGTRTSSFDQEKSNRNDYNMRHQHSEEGSSGNSSDFSGNSSNGDRSEPDHYGTRTSIFDQDKSNRNDYNMRHQHSEEGKYSGTSSPSEFWNRNYKTESIDNHMTNMYDNEDSCEIPHYPTRNATAAEDDDNADVPHHQTRNITAEKDEDDDVSHYPTRNSIAEEDEDNDEVSHYRNQRHYC